MFFLPLFGNSARAELQSRITKGDFLLCCLLGLAVTGWLSRVSLWLQVRQSDFPAVNRRLTLEQIFYSQSVFSKSKENENKKWLQNQEETLQFLSITRGILSACSQALESFRRLILHSINRIRCSLSLFWHVSVLDLCNGEEVFQLWSQWFRERRRKPLRSSEKTSCFCYENTKSVCRLLTSEEGVQASNLLSDKVINYLIPFIKLDGPKNYSQLGNALQVIFGILHLSLGPWGHEGYWEVETLNMEHGVVWSGKDETQRASGCSKLCQKKLQSQWGQRFT